MCVLSHEVVSDSQRPMVIACDNLCLWILQAGMLGGLPCLLQGSLPGVKPQHPLTSPALVKAGSSH